MPPLLDISHPIEKYDVCRQKTTHRPVGKNSPRTKPKAIPISYKKALVSLTAHRDLKNTAQSCFLVAEGHQGGSGLDIQDIFLSKFLILSPQHFVDLQISPNVDSVMVCDMTHISSVFKCKGHFIQILGQCCNVHGCTHLPKIVFTFHQQEGFLHFSIQTMSISIS